MENRHSTDEVCAVAGITRRQLDGWIDKGYLDRDLLTGSGIPRRYSDAQLERICEIAEAFRAAVGALDAAGLPGTLIIRRRSSAAA